jgi:hypothetical protein
MDLRHRTRRRGAQARDQREPDTERGGLLQLHWQNAHPVTASRVEAPQVSAHAVPQVNWQTTGVTEISRGLGVSRLRAHQLANRPDFPAWLDKVAGHRAWLRWEVECYIRIHRPDADFPALDHDLQLPPRWLGYSLDLRRVGRRTLPASADRRRRATSVYR